MRKLSPFRSLITQVTFIAVVGLATASGLALAAILAFDADARRTQTTSLTTAWLQSLAIQVESALVFGDSETAQQILNASGVYTNTLALVAMRLDRDQPLAVYPPSLSHHQALALVSQPSGDDYLVRQLSLAVPVLSGDEVVGRVMGVVDLMPMWHGVLRHGLLLLATFVLAGLVAGLLIRTLLRQVIAPVSGLTDVVQGVAHTQDFSVRVKAHANDEIGLLSEGVNHMLEQIEHRDVALQTSHDHVLALKVQADQASQAKGEFLAHMSHEIRTPLSAINVSAFLALTQLPDGPLRRHVERIAQAGEHLQSIVNDVLDFSKIEAGKVELETLPFAWAQMLHRLDELLGPQARSKGLRFNLYSAPDVPPWLVGDPVRVQQVLVNLVGNALKFTAAGSIDLTTEVLAMDAHVVRLRVTVADTGLGIPPERMALLFQSFQQLDASTSRHFGGTGLGLAISRQLVALMGGEMGVESTPGQGSRFWFTLSFPWCVDGATPNSPGLADIQGQLQGSHWLVVDDSPFNQQVATALLEMAGAQVSVVGDGHAALQALSGQPFDGVLMDLNMPGMDGLETMRRIRANPAWHTLPVVAMTASAQAQDRELSLAAGMHAHVVKPFDPAALVALLVRCLQSAGGPVRPIEDNHTQST